MRDEIICPTLNQDQGTILVKMKILYMYAVCTGTGDGNFFYNIVFECIHQGMVSTRSQDQVLNGCGQCTPDIQYFYVQSFEGLFDRRLR